MATVALPRTGQKIDNATCADTVYNAIKLGYRLLDGAADYGNEKEAGQGVRRAIDEGLIKREDICTFHIWNTNHAYEHVKSACKKQLADWGLEYFDLLHVHFPIALEYVDPAHRYPPAWWGDDGKTVTLPEKTSLRETWKAMEELVDEGLTENIGIRLVVLRNCAGALLNDLLQYTRIAPQVLQIELHPYLSQDNYIALAKELGIVVTAYSSFGPQGYYELGVKGVRSFFEHDTVLSVAKANNKTPAQVLLRWATQRDIVVIPKSTRPEILSENLNSTNFDLSEEDMKALGSLNVNLRLNDPREIDPRLAIFA
ncbi:Aldo/keto reductase [Vararia minispora EC-137]|uniref:Aldo/keto reductase n=1 Tax=Vararia minispora EC-137 TaxID=1314806 RepID=A0ACB8QIB2_9AGAM|nr:Aldo/keto reductase [Vararia minispora EC-137]